MDFLGWSLRLIGTHRLGRKYHWFPLDVAYRSGIVRSCSVHIPFTKSSGGTHGKRAAGTSGRASPIRRRVSASGRAAPSVRSELQRISKSPYLNAEDLLEEIKLKKMKLHCKDEMERIAARILREQRDPSNTSFAA